MNFSKFFSNQAMRPSGLFGRMVMPVVFNVGNAYLNQFVNELMDIQPGDRVLEIGCGTGKLMRIMAERVETGWVEGVDFSAAMVKIAKRKNRKKMADGIVNIVEADFDRYSALDSTFTKACTVNTLYFWKKPKETIRKTARLLSPGGRFIIAFEDKGQLETKGLAKDVFSFYSQSDVRQLLEDGGFNNGVCIESREKQKLRYHCAVAEK